MSVSDAMYYSMREENQQLKAELAMAVDALKAAKECVRRLKIYEYNDKPYIQICHEYHRSIADITDKSLKDIATDPHAVVEVGCIEAVDYPDKKHVHWDASGCKMSIQMNKPGTLIVWPGESEGLKIGKKLDGVRARNAMEV